MKPKALVFGHTGQDGRLLTQLLLSYGFSVIGISSGASAPEKLVQNLLDNLRKDRKISIEEVIVAEEKVVFKLPKELN